MRAIIIDDEQHASVALHHMINEHCPDINVLGTADSIETGLDAIHKHSPELVFLDVELQTGNAFDLLEKLGSINFEIIFTTAYDHYAIRAIKYSALDYLLKPIDIDDLINAVDKTQRKRTPSPNLTDIKNLLSNINTPHPKKISVPSLDAVFFLDIDDIIRCQADSNYTRFFVMNKQNILVTKTLKEYEELLFDQGFMRIHHAHLINLKHVKKFIKNDNTLLMSDEVAVEISRRKKAEVLAKLSAIPS